MYMNVTHVGLIATANGHVGISLSTAELDEDRAKRDYAPSPFTVYLTAEEAFYAALIVNGVATFNPWFDDLGYKIRFFRDAIRVDHGNGGVARHIYGTGDTIYDPTAQTRWPRLHALLDKLLRKLETGPRPYVPARQTGEWEHGTFLEEWYLTFPTCEISYLLVAAVHRAVRYKADADANRKAANDLSVPYYQRPSVDYDVVNRRWSHTFHPDTLAHWKQKYAPKIRMVFRGDAKDGYLAALHDERVVNQPDHYSLKSQMQDLARMARNSSDGQTVTVHIGPEHNGDAPLSFNWCILNHKDQRIINGGIIAHANRATKDQAESLGLVWPDDAEEKYYHRPITGYSYSTHT